jgi:hypothetical protein
MEPTTIFEAALTDLTGQFQNGAHDSRNYQRKKIPSDFYTPEFARFKLVMYFKDGRTRWYYSYDTIKFQGGARCDEYESLVKLLRIVKNNHGEYKNAIIYATVDEIPEVKKVNYNYEVAKFNFYGQHTENEYVTFKAGATDFKMDLGKLKLGSKKIVK